VPDVVWPGLCLVVAGGAALLALRAADAPGWLAAATAIVLAAACVGWCVLLRGARRRRREALELYAGAGWFDESEAAQLSSPAARREGLRWAARRRASAQYRHVVSTADALARARRRVQARPRDVARRAQEARLLARSQSAREALRSAVIHGPGGWTAN